MNPDPKEKQNKRIGLIVSVGAHVVLLLLFVFLVAWRAPNPPLPEIGIELNFGTSDAGSGTVEPESEPVATEPADTQPETPAETSEENTESEQPESTPTQETEADNTPAEPTAEPVSEEPTTDPVSEPQEQPEQPEEPVKEKEKEDKPPPPKVLYPGNKDGNKQAQQSDNPAGASQGDKPEATGNQGDEQGQVDARSLYGKPGGGGGAALEMTGWRWDKEPRPEHGAVKQDGKIVFEVTIDEYGEVVSVVPVKWTVTTSLMKIYQQAVEELTFTKTSSGPAPPFTKGKITFIIEAK
ncbi:MAG TPA: hypothetical protein ENJ39_05065 [Flammeovirgaceae bacterium]|nr:hypothetical protein [Flammeovirgaceae bacterium]